MNANRWRLWPVCGDAAGANARSMFENPDIWRWFGRPAENLTEKARNAEELTSRTMRQALELASQKVREARKLTDPQERTEAGVALMMRWIMPVLGDRLDYQPRRINFVRTAELPQHMPPPLPRPVLFLHGYNAAVTEFCEMVSWLSGCEANRDGGRLGLDNLDGIDCRSRLFRLEFTTPYQRVSDNVLEISAAVEAICRAVRCGKIDVVAHSKGGLDVRAYLDEDNSRVARVVTIATPHKGAELADMCCRFRQKLGGERLACDDNIMRLEMLREFFVDETDDNGCPNNEFLQRLNANWQRQCGQTRFLALGGVGIPTFISGGLTFNGDGIVTFASATALPGAEIGEIKGVIHSHLPATVAAMEQTASFLTAT